MLDVLLWLILVVVGLWAFARFRLLGEDLSRFDEPRATPVGGPGRPPSDQNAAIERRVREIMAAGRSAPVKGRLAAARANMDALGETARVNAEITPCSADGVPAEWVIAPGAQANRRVLYIHGGGFVAGSPRSHRAITARFSAQARAAVLAIDYRLMPENKRMAGIEDCRTAYRWILENGPEGPAAAEFLVVAGDSAGGNLTFSTIAWARDAQLRAADAAVALSPATDATLASPSLAANQASDVMLGPVFGPVTKAPRAITALWALIANRMSPSGALLSPLRGRLDGLPPTLVHASAAEMLLDDAQRYVNKATAEGSPARLEVWDHMLHVWHIFAGDLPEGEEAFEHIGAFLREIELLQDAEVTGSDAASSPSAAAG